MKRVIGCLIIASAAVLLLNNQESTKDKEEKVFVAIKSDSTEVVNPKKEAKYDFSCLTPKSNVVEKEIVYQSQEKIAFQNFQINPNLDTNIYLSTGTEIHIPKNAFVDENSKLIKSPVNIQFREFHSPASIALAEINMSLGDKSMLMSGGMFQIKADENKSEVKVNPKTKIKVLLASSEKDEKFNYYFLNPKTNQWEDKGDLNFDTTVTAAKLAPKIRWWEFTEDFENQTGFFRPRGAGVVVAVREHELKSFRRWAKNPKSASKANFYTLFSKRRAPQNAPYRYLSWRLSEKNSPEVIEQFLLNHDAKKEAAHSFWSDLNIVKCDEGYQAHFSKGDDHMVLSVIPDSKNYPGDNKFDARLYKWEEKLLKRDNRDLNLLFAEAEHSIGHLIKDMNQEEINRFARLNAIDKREIEQLIKSRRFNLPDPKTPYKAELAINSFGTHNIDAPVDYIVYGAGNIYKSPIWMIKGAYNAYARSTRKKYMKKRRSGYPTLDEEPKDNSTVDKITVVQKGINTSFEFKHENLAKFEFSNHYENLGIAFLADGTYKVIPPKEFKGHSDKTAFFNFECIEATSDEELKEVITELGFKI